MQACGVITLTDPSLGGAQAFSLRNTVKYRTDSLCSGTDRRVFLCKKNPPNCVGGIRVIIRAFLLVSRLLVSLRNTSIQFTLLVYYFLVFYNYLIKIQEFYF
jgi:hypothetical protein